MKTKDKKLLALVLTTSLVTSMNVPSLVYANDSHDVEKIQGGEQLNIAEGIQNEQIKLENKEEKVSVKEESVEKIQDNGIEINNKTFPDENFSRYIRENFDKNKDGKLSDDEIANVTYIYVNEKQIKSLKGIDIFKNLKTLYANNNYIEEIDLSNNKNLEYVECNNNKINTIYLPNEVENNTLKYLDVFSNDLKSINLKNLKALGFLHIDDNKLTELDLSDNPLNSGHGFVAQNNYMQKITLPNNKREYPWVEFLATQLYPEDKNIGYKIKWYLNEEKTQILDTEKTKEIKCEGQTLYAEYVPIEYKVKFNPGIAQGESKTQDFKYGQSQELLKNEFIKPGYDFIGWKSDSGKIYSDEQLVNNLTDVEGKVINLTAIWQEKDYKGEHYTINLYDGESLIKSIKGTYGETINLPNNEMNKEDYTFLGWNFGSGNHVIYKDVVKFDHPDDLPGKLTDDEEKSLDLYATWRKNEDNKLLDSTITISNKSLSKSYDGKQVDQPVIEKTGSTKEVEFTWYKMVGNEWKEINSSPVNVGKYKVVASVESDGKYNSVSTEKVFEITKATNSWTEEPAIVEWTEGSEVNKPVGKAKFGQVIFTYSNSQDGIFTSNIPTEAGTWYMKVTVKGSENYTGLEKIIKFTIKEAIQAVSYISISNGINNTNEFTYGENIIIKIKLSDTKLNVNTFQTKEIGVFVNGKQITKSQLAINGQELTFEYNTVEGLIKSGESVNLKVAYINNGEEGTEIASVPVMLNAKEVDSSNINIPDIDENTDLDKLEIKDKNYILKQGIDYDVVKSQKGNKVTVRINFKENYSGTIEKDYIIQEPEQPENPVVPDEGKDNNLVGNIVKPGSLVVSDDSKDENLGQNIIKSENQLALDEGKDENSRENVIKPENQVVSDKDKDKNLGGNITKPENPVEKDEVSSNSNDNISNTKTVYAMILGVIGVGILSLIRLYISRKNKKLK